MFPLFMHFGSAPDPLLLLFMAIALDAALGDMPRLFRLVPHPVVLIGRVIGVLDRRLNQPERSDMTRRLRGLAMAVGMIAAAVAGYHAAHGSHGHSLVGLALELGHHGARARGAGLS